MSAPLAKLTDWSALQLSAMLRPRLNGRTPRLKEAMQFLQGSDFIPAESQPARIKFEHGKSGVHFRFPTPRPCDCAENNILAALRDAHVRKQEFIARLRDQRL